MKLLVRWLALPFALLALLVAILPVAGNTQATGQRAAVLAAANCSPKQVADLGAWWDVSDTSTITQAGGVASQLDDKSGNGRHLVQATGAAQPAVVANARNGRTVLRFDGSNDRMSTAAAISGSGVTLIFIGKSTKTASGVRIIATTAGGDPANNKGFELTHEDRGSSNGTNTLGFSVNTGTSGALADKFIYFGKNNGYTDASWVMSAAAYSLNDRAKWHNGSDQAPYDTYGTGVGVNAYVSSALAFTLGALADGTAAAAIDFGEGMIFTRRLSSIEIGGRARCAAAKWGPQP